MPHYPSRIEHSGKYEDARFQFKHVKLPREVFRQMPRGRLLSRDELDALGVSHGPQWEQYCLFRNEPHVLLFRRPRAAPRRDRSPLRLL